MSAATHPSGTSERTPGSSAPRKLHVALGAIFLGWLLSGCLVPPDDSTADDSTADDELTSEVSEAIVEEADVEAGTEADDESDGLDVPLQRLPPTEEDSVVRPGDARAEPEPIPWHGIGDPHANSKP